MKRNWYLLMSVAILLLVSSCKEDDPEPLKAETQAVLLAGSKGSSKSWKLSVATYQEGSDPSVDFDLTTCILDNIYSFTNNDDQSYRATEGASRCDSADPDLLEAGNWTFTLDGKILVILPDEVNYVGGALFSSLSYPSEILDLTETSMKLKMNVVELGSSYSYTLTFVKI